MWMKGNEERENMDMKGGTVNGGYRTSKRIQRKINRFRYSESSCGKVVGWSYNLRLYWRARLYTLDVYVEDIILSFFTPILYQFLKGLRARGQRRHVW